MKKTTALSLLLISGFAHSDVDLSGTWNCVMTSSSTDGGGLATSSLVMDMPAGQYERSGDIKIHVKELGGFTVHTTTYEKGTVQSKGGRISFFPLEVSSEVIDSGPLPKSMLPSSNEALLADETGLLMEVSADAFTAVYPSGTTDKCVKAPL